MTPTRLNGSVVAAGSPSALRPASAPGRSRSSRAWTRPGSGRSADDMVAVDFEETVQVTAPATTTAATEAPINVRFGIVLPFMTEPGKRPGLVHVESAAAT
ncbi:hypothetical protein [Spirillospora sp. CA-128828]|uniref:hypothetical protein n=1 Tax=Spirillospora sp. CA-128828 TaxID=3240033 RepID=UPI003D8E71D6